MRLRRDGNAIETKKPEKREIDSVQRRLKMMLAGRLQEGSDPVYHQKAFLEMTSTR